MKRVAITGVAGYIGGLLLSQLEEIETVERIVGIDTVPPKSNSPKLRFYGQDILKTLADIFSENAVDSAVHLVFVVKSTHDKMRAQKVDIDGTLNFLEACRQARVKHILYLSSHTVYGAHPGNTRPFKEDSPPNPLNSFQYSEDKAEVERILGDFAMAHRDICVTTLRSCPVIGPNAANSVATLMFRPIMLRIAGYDPPMQFVHEYDLVKLITALLMQRKGGIFNVAGEGEVRYSEIARLAGRKTMVIPEKLFSFLIGFSWALHLQSESPPSGLDFIKYPPLVSTEKVKKETGFRFNYSSREAIAAFLSTQ
jgi:UDP-glucose 4-epimerase